MVTSWLPEPPTDGPFDEIQASNDVAIPGSDVSDTEEDENQYDGYEPLPLGPTNENNDESENDTENEDCNSQNWNTNSSIPSASTSDALPSIDPIDRTLIREVWSGPAPQFVDIEMDQVKANEVKMAMANFTLPPTSIPEWAANVPEDQWKEQLISRIQNLKENRN